MDEEDAIESTVAEKIEKLTEENRIYMEYFRETKEFVQFIFGKEKTETYFENLQNGSSTLKEILSEISIEFSKKILISRQN